MVIRWPDVVGEHLEAACFDRVNAATARAAAVTTRRIWKHTASPRLGEQFGLCGGESTRLFDSLTALASRAAQAAPMGR